jgi:hypothetical protein
LNGGQHAKSRKTNSRHHPLEAAEYFPPTPLTPATSGLPDGLFSNQKSQFGEILEGLILENTYIFYGHLEYFMEIWDIL